MLYSYNNMNKRIFIVIAFLCMVTGLHAGDVVNLKQHSTLQAEIQKLENLDVTNLTITGPISGADLKYLRSNPTRLSNLDTLDLRDITFVADGVMYYSITTLHDHMFDVAGRTWFYVSGTGDIYTKKYSDWQKSAIMYYSPDLACAFSGFTKLKHVVFPSCAKGVGVNCFSGCTSLLSVEFPTKPQYFNSGAFDGCSSLVMPVEIVEEMKTVGGLSGVQLSNSVLNLDKAETILSNAFQNTKLEELTIGTSVKSIGDAAFSGSSLKKVSMENSPLTELSSSCFYNNKNLSTISLPKGLKIIGTKALSGCSALEKIELPETVEYINSSVFYGNSNLQKINVPKNLRRVGPNCFFNTLVETEFLKENGITYWNTIAYALEKNYLSTEKAMTIKEGTTILADDLFPSNNLMKSLILPSSLKVIGYNLQLGNVRELIIPENVEYIYGGISGSSLLRVRYNAVNLINELDDELFPSTLEQIIIGDNLETIPNGFLAGTNISITITLSNKIKSIGRRAFNSNHLTVSIPKDNIIECIGDYAFSGASLTDVNVSLPHCTSIGGRAFYNTGLESIELTAEELMEIPDEAFINMESLKFISFSPNLSRIGKSAFYGCKDCVFPELTENITYIGESAFRGCERLGKVKLNNNMKRIEASSFYGCVNLEIESLPDSLVYIGSSAFSGCPLLAGLEIPSKVTSVGSSAFSASVILLNPAEITQFSSSSVNINSPQIELVDGIYYLANIALLSKYMKTPEVVELRGGTTLIASGFAYGDYDLYNSKVLILPKSIERINSGGLYNRFTEAGGIYDSFSSSVTDIYINSSTLPILDAPVDYRFTIHLLKNKKEEILQNLSANWTNSSVTFVFDIEDPSSVSFLSFAFNPSEKTWSVTGCDGEVSGSIVVPETMTYDDGQEYPVTSIGADAFKRCSSITSVTLPECVTSIGESAFNNCTSLASINIPEGVTSIGYAAFYHCPLLTSIVLPESVTSIGGSAFGWCTSLASINIPESVTSIGERAFAECSSLTSIVLPKNLRTIEGTIFQHCSSLTSINIPESVDSIGVQAFNGCMCPLVFEGTTPPAVHRASFSYYKGTRIIVPFGRGEIYRNAYPDVAGKIEEVAQPTDIERVNVLGESDVPVYDLRGVPVKRLVKGNVYIRNRQKFVAE